MNLFDKVPVLILYLHTEQRTRTHIFTLSARELMLVSNGLDLFWYWSATPLMTLLSRMTDAKWNHNQRSHVTGEPREAKREQSPTYRNSTQSCCGELNDAIFFRKLVKNYLFAELLALDCARSLTLESQLIFHEKSIEK